MQRADQAGVIGMKTDRQQVDLEIFALEDDVGAGNHEFADPALAKAAADDDALGIGPCLGLEEFPGHMGQFLRKFLNRAMHQRRGMDIVADQCVVELALGDLLGGFLAQGIVAVLLQRLAQGFEDVSERALAGAVAEKSAFVLQFDIEAVDLHRRQPGGAVPGDARGCDAVFCHATPCPAGFRGDNDRGTLWFHWVGLVPIRPMRPKSFIFGRFLPVFSLTHGFQRL